MTIENELVLILYIPQRTDNNDVIQINAIKSTLRIGYIEVHPNEYIDNVNIHTIEYNMYGLIIYLYNIMIIILL